MGRPLSDEEVDGLWVAYQTHDTPTGLSVATGRSFATCSKYINKGDPTRGIEPLKDRLTRIRKQVQREADYSLADSLVENLKIVRPIKARLAIELNRQLERGRTTKHRQILDKESGKVIANEQTIEELVHRVGDLDKLVKLEGSLLGKPDEVILVQVRAIAGLVFALMRAEGIDDEKILRIAERVEELAPAQMETAERKAT